jgi:transposase
MCNSSSRNDARVWKARRKKAEHMFAAGEGQAAIARALGVSRQCVHNWFWQWRHAGAVRDRRPLGSGRRSRLDDRQMAAVDAALRQGPLAFGFASERWTLWRVAVVIERVTGIRYHSSSVWRILRSMGWTLRLPPRSRRKKSGYVPREWVAPTEP